MFSKLRKILVKEGIKAPEYQQIFKNVIGYDDIKLLLYKMITSLTDNLLSWPEEVLAASQSAQPGFALN